MTTPTYELLDSVVLTSDASSIEFTSIPTTDSSGNDLADLVLITHIITDGTSSPHIKVNDLASQNYKFSEMNADDGGNVSSTFRQSSAIAYSMGDGGVSGKLIFGIFQFLDYTATDKFKSFLAELGGPDVQQTRNYGGVVTTTSRITKISTAFGGFGAGTKFELYGIAK